MRQSFLKFYKSHEVAIIMLSRFILMIIALVSINKAIGMSTTISNIWTILTLAVIAMFLRSSAIVTISMFVIVYHLSGISLILAGIVAAVCIATYVMYIRLFPRESIVILFTMLLLPIDAVYVVPLVSALFFGVSAIVAIACGCIFYYMFCQLPIMVGSNQISGFSLDALEIVVNNLLRNTFFNTEILTIITILSVVFLMVYIIRLQAIDYANYVAVCVGGVISTLGFLISQLLLHTRVSITLMLLMTIVSVIIASFIAFLSIVLDYSRAEHVQFEDENNFYYVKVVPKIELHEQTQTTQVFGGTENHF
ncbi:MAG: hypothetical protein BEN18_09025 [Epulopiscium sp. Nuni2H_MBin001]|nr:MAG: hypothetical protein BEN18_09025 [Epulopiscium sp. Nuni2H_MBin001]